MSIKLMSQVWECDLAPNLTLVLLAMADIARDDGSRCYPSVGFLAWKCGYSPRQIQRTIQELRTMNVLLVVAHDEGGRGNATEYLIKLDHLERKTAWEIVRERGQNKGDRLTPLVNGKGDTCDDKGCHAAHVKGDIQDTKGRHLRHERVTPTSPHTLVNVNDPLVDPLVDPDGEKSKYWNTVLAILQQQVTRPSFETSLKATRCVSVDDEVVVVEVANSFVKQMLNDRMYSLIYQAAQQIRPGIKEIMFEVAQATEGIEAS